MGTRKYIYTAPHLSTDIGVDFYNKQINTNSYTQRAFYFRGGADANQNVSITLDNRYGYTGGNCNEFIVEVTYVDTTATLKIIDSTGGTIADQTILKAGKYLFRWIDNTYGWKYIKSA